MCSHKFSPGLRLEHRTKLQQYYTPPSETIYKTSHDNIWAEYALDGGLHIKTWFRY
jgi:hypothetical protein